MSKLSIILIVSALIQVESPAIKVEDRATYYSHAQLVAAAGSEADGATLVSDAIWQFLAGRPAADVAVVAEQLPSGWLPVMPSVRFRRLTSDALPDAVKGLQTILSVRQISRDDREALVVLSLGTRCQGVESHRRYLRRPGGWQRAPGLPSGGGWGTSCHAADPPILTPPGAPVGLGNVWLEWPWASRHPSIVRHHDHANRSQILNQPILQRFKDQTSKILAILGGLAVSPPVASRL